jgi:hypothetical protein
VARPGLARHGMVRHGGFGGSWQGEVRFGEAVEARRVTVGRRKARRGGYGLSRSDAICSGWDWLGELRRLRRGLAGCGKTRRVQVRHGKAGRLWQSPARQGEARHGRARRLRHGGARSG